jgi:hypothetical protein
VSKSVEVSALPDCDFDASHGPAFADFKVPGGPWGYGCKSCFVKYGGSLGLGKGQKLVLAPPVDAVVAA